jgi:tetraacyldisaccharide 4'-kinase
VAFIEAADSRLAPTIVARDRVAGAQLARFGGASVIVMDDGFQNPSLEKDLSILVVDGRRGIGNGRIIPAGPLRAPLGVQIARAQALVIVGPAGSGAAVVDVARHHGLAIFHARLEPDRQHLASLRGHRILAFAGIADPQKFFATLADAGIPVAERLEFADHHRYTAAEAQALLARADTQNLMLLTTEKDHVRLTGDPQLAALAGRTAALPVRFVVDEELAFRDMIVKVVRRG